MRQRQSLLCQKSPIIEGRQVEQSIDSGGRTSQLAASIADDALHCSDTVPAPIALDNLHALPVSDEEIAAVEAFLGLEAAMILGDDQASRRKAI